MEENPNSFESAEQLIRGLGLDRPVGDNGAIGPNQPHRRVVPKGRLKMTAKVGQGSLPKRRVVPPPVIAQVPYDEYEYYDEENDGPEDSPTYSTVETVSAVSPRLYEGPEAFVHIELRVPVTQLKRLLDAIS